MAHTHCWTPAGIQLFSDIPDCSAWVQFIRDIGMYDDRVLQKRIHMSHEVLKLVRDVFIPFGIPRGSDSQASDSSLKDLTERPAHRPRRIHALCAWAIGSDEVVERNSLPRPEAGPHMVEG